MNAYLAELKYALDELDASGIAVMANLHGKYLGDKLYEPIWAELDRRGAVSHSHLKLNSYTLQEWLWAQTPVKEQLFCLVCCHAIEPAWVTY